MTKNKDWLKLWTDRTLFLYPEIIFTYAVESFKASSKMLVGYELFVGSAHPHNYTWFVLYGCGLLTLLTAFLSDNYIGKYITIMYGLVFFTVSCLLFTIAFTLEVFIKKQISILYTVSFACLLIYVSTSGIRNVMLMEQVENMDHMRTAIFVLVFTRVVARAVTSLDVQFRIMTSILHWNAAIAFVLSLIYLILWIKDGNKCIFEPNERNILIKCIKCVYAAVKNVSKKEKPTEPYDADYETKLQSAKPIRLSKSVKYLNKSHWVYHSVPHSPQETIEETIDLIDAIPWVIPGVVMGNLIYYVLATSAHQILLFGYDSPLNFAFVKMYTMIFEVFFFPIAFVLGIYLRPFKSDLISIMVSYLCVLTAAISMVIVQDRIDSMKYLPRPYTARIRLINLCPFDQVIDADWLGGVVTLKYFSLTNRVVSVDQPVDYKRIMYLSSNWTDHDIKLFEQRSTSHVFTTYGPFHKEEPDPTNDPDREADIFFFSVVTDDVPINNISLIFFNRKTKKETVIKNPFKTKSFKIAPGNYRIESKNGTYHDGRIWSHVIDFDVNLLSHSLGTIVAVYAKGYFGLVGGKYFMLDRTMEFRYILLFQMAMTSVGNALASASFFRFLFYQSPSKMRGMLLTIIIAFDLLTVGFYARFGKFLINMMIPHVIVHLGLFLVFIVFFFWRLSWTE